MPVDILDARITQLRSEFVSSVQGHRGGDPHGFLRQHRPAEAARLAARVRVLSHEALDLWRHPVGDPFAMAPWHDLARHSSELLQFAADFLGATERRQLEMRFTEACARFGPPWSQKLYAACRADARGELPRGIRETEEALELLPPKSAAWYLVQIDRLDRLITAGKRREAEQLLVWLRQDRATMRARDPRLEPRCKSAAEKLDLLVRSGELR
jgi:hypothetical protein